MRKRFLVQNNLDETDVRRILDSILLGVRRTTHKVTYKTSKGVVEYISIPLRRRVERYASEGITGTLRKISLRSRGSTEELEELLRSNGVEMAEIIKDGPRALTLRSDFKIKRKG